MTVVSPGVRHNDSPSPHLKYIAVIVLCGILFFLAMLPPFLASKAAFSDEQWDQLVQQTSLQYDQNCSPFGALLSCVEVHPP
jgi:hypothetical protein